MDRKNQEKIGKIALSILFAAFLTACLMAHRFTLSDNAGFEDYKRAYNSCMQENLDLKKELIEAMEIITNLLNCPKD